MSSGTRFQFKLPRGDESSSGRLISRGHFLDGSVKCFLGPGQQRWDYGQTWYLDQYTQYTIPYESPTDWMAAGRLLATPQVVFFGVNVVVGTMYGDWYSYLPGQNIYYPPSGRDEYLRLSGLMGDVKSRIEGLRPGKTFVINSLWSSIEWHPTPSSIGPLYRFFSLQENYQSLGKTTSIVVPPSEYPGHVKTDLLVISVGASLDASYVPPGYIHRITNMGVDSSFPAGSSVEDAVNEMISPTHSSTISPYQDSLNLMRGGYDKFPRYAAKLYGYHTNFAAPDSLTLFEGPFPPEEAQALADAFYGYKAWLETTNREFVKRIASDLSDFGYSYMGESQSLDEDEFVRIVSEHFGFDPNTGADLPISQV